MARDYSKVGVFGLSDKELAELVFKIAQGREKSRVSEAVAAGELSADEVLDDALKETLDPALQDAADIREMVGRMTDSQVLEWLALLEDSIRAKVSDDGIDAADMHKFDVGVRLKIWEALWDFLSEPDEALQAAKRVYAWVSGDDEEETK